MNRPWLDRLNISADSAFDGADEATFSIADFIALVRRRIAIIVAVTVLGVLAGGAYLFLTKPVYKASSLVLIDPRRPAAFVDEASGPQFMRENFIIDSQIQIITSNELLKRAATALNLDQVPRVETPSLSAQFKSWIYDTLNIAESEASERSVKEDGDAKAYKTLKGGLTVQRVRLTYAIRINYASTDAAWAAKVANAVASSFVEDKLESRLASARQANEWLRERVSDLQKQVIEAERSVELYKAEHDIVAPTVGKLVTDEQLSELNSQLIVAKAEMAQAKARLDRINAIVNEGNADAAVEDALSNEVITELRNDFTKWSRIASKLKAGYGEKHLGYLNAKSEMERIEEHIIGEMKRIAGSYESSYKIAQSRVTSLEGDLNKAKGIHVFTGQKQLKLRELERRAKSLRDLLNQLLSQSGKSNIRESLPAGQASDVRIIEYAETPNFATWPSKRRVLALSLLFGIAAGLGLAFLRETLDSFVWTPTDLEKILPKRSFGMLPKLDMGPIKVRKKRVRKKKSGQKHAAGKQVHRVQAAAQSMTKHPHLAPFLHSSVPGDGTDDAAPHIIDAKALAPYHKALSDRFNHVSEILRNMLMSTRQAGDKEAGAQVMAFVSTIPGEGKSTISTLQALYHAKNGTKTLLIDSDFRKPSLTRTLAPNVASTRPTLTSTKSGVVSSIWHDKHTGLDFMPVFTGRADMRPADVVLKGEFADIVESFREQYDYIIVDLPPLLVLPDARLLAELIDHFVYVVEWGKVKKQAIAEAMKHSPEITERILGSVFNKVDLDKIQKYGTYYYGSYEYYK